MTTLSIPKSYAAGQILTKADLDNIESAVETYLNVTQIGYENIDIDSTLDSLSQSQAETILTSAGYGTLVTTTLGGDQPLTTSLANYNTVSNVSAGTYLVNAVALVELTRTAFTGSVAQNGLTMNLYNITSSSYIIPETLIGSTLQTGHVNTSIISFLSTTRKGVFQYIYPLTLTATSDICFRGSVSTTTLGSGTLKQNSFIQLYRIKAG